jgi:hypothetical protein
MRDLHPNTEAALRKAKQHIIGRHGSDPNFAGAGIGFRFRAGEWTEEPAVIVMLVRKRTEALVAQDRLLPKTVEIDGQTWGVDVLQGGPFKLHHLAPPAAAVGTAELDTAHLARDIRREQLIAEKTAAMAAGLLPQTQLERPPLQGVSLSNVVDGPVAGTLGCYVRDATDQTINILSCNHVLARTNSGIPGQAIIQPGGIDGGTSADGVAKLKRFAPLASGTEVDAAIAQVNNQTAVSLAISGGLMDPISATHPVTGMVVAGDGSGGATFLTQMDTTLASLNIELILPGAQPPAGGAGASAGVARPKVGMNIEKVGRTTGYTSATILGLGFDVPVDTEGSAGIVTYTNLIYCQFFSLPGDSGSVACVGGDGNESEILQFLSQLALCPLLAAVTSYYQIPVSNAQNSQLSDDLRDKFLSQSSTGQLLIGATYVNAQTVISRLQADTGPRHLQSIARARALSLYNQFHALATTLIEGSNPTAVVTSSMVGAMASVLHGLAASVHQSGTGMLTAAESAAGHALFTDILRPALGMTRAQLIDYMNTDSVYQKVFSQLHAVPTLQVPGPATVAPVKSP